MPQTNIITLQPAHAQTVQMQPLAMAVPHVPQAAAPPATLQGGTKAGGNAIHAKQDAHHAVMVRHVTAVVQAGIRRLETVVQKLPAT